LFRLRRASPVEALRAVLDRIAAFDPQLNAFCLHDAQQPAASSSSVRHGQSSRAASLGS
jgi:Asp-tRNA(Asn)/Glu-tRNA(Gln) amidotransferase A subunit family amidase